MATVLAVVAGIAAGAGVPLDPTVLGGAVIAVVWLWLLLIVRPRVLAVAFIFVSLALPKAGVIVHGIPMDLGVVLSGTILLRWLLQSVISPIRGTPPMRRFRAVLGLWTLWLVAECALGMLQGITVIDLAVETIPLLVPPLVALRLVALGWEEETWLPSTLAAARWAIVLVCLYGMMQNVLPPSHIDIPGLTTEFGGGSSANAILLRDNLTGQGLKTVSTYQNGNLLGGFLALVAPLAFALWRGWKRWAVATIIGTVTILTLSRGAWISVGMSIMALALFARPYRGLLLLVPVVGASVSAFGRIASRATFGLMTLDGRTSQYAGLVSGMLLGSAPLVLFHLFVGFGLGGSAHLPTGVLLGTVDSSLGRILLNLGLVGLGLYLWMVRAAIGPWPKTLLGRAILAGLIGALVFQAVDQQLFLTPTSWNFWLMVALLVTVERRTGKEPSPTGDPRYPGAPV